MNIKKFKGPIILLIAAFFWGTTFVAQSLGSDYVGPFTYNAGRFLITGIILSIICLIRKPRKIETIKSNKWIYIMSILVGVALFLGATFQQLGIDITKSSSKSGFLSSLYILFVPIIGLLFKKKVSPTICIFLAIALAGSYLITINENFTIELGDILTIVCAVMFALQIVLVDQVNPYIDAIKLSAIQFIVAGVLSTIFMLFTEEIIFVNIINASPAILYAAIFSGCIAFTLQIVGQKYTEASVASLIMSLESVFALLGGVIILSEDLSLRMIIGCVLIFLAVILSQIDFKKILNK